MQPDPVHPGTSNVKGVLAFGAEYDEHGRECP
jgi:hypothetical protein